MTGFLCPAMAEETPDIYVLATNGSAVLAEETGSVLVWPGQYASIEPLGQSGLYAARRLSGGGLGVIRADGSALTAFAYSALDYDGSAIVFSENGRCGAMNLAGEVVIEPLYTRLVSMDDGWLALKTSSLDDTPDALWRVNADGTEHHTGIHLSFGPLAASEGLAEAADTLGRWGWLNGEGAWAIEPQFVWCGPFRDGLACAASETGTGLVDRAGDWVIEPLYDRLARGPANRPLLAFQEGAVSLIAQDGTAVARFEGEGADAAYTDGLISVALEGRRFLVDSQGSVVYEAPAGVAALDERGGCIIEQRGFSELKPFRFHGTDGALHESWQELSFAGLYEGRAYLIFSEYSTAETAYEAQGFVFHDEVIGTRRYGILNDEGDVIAGGFTSLKRTGRALLTAETESWIGLIRPNGTVIMSLEKAE